MMKAQFSIVSLIFLVILIIVYGAFLPAINGFINAVLPTADPATATLLQLFPMIVLLLIIMGMWVQGRSDTF